MMFPLMTFFFPSPPQRPRGSRKERPVPDVFQAPQRGKPVGGAREFPVGALQPLQHPWKDLPVWELPVFRQPGRKPVPCHHPNARGNAKQRRHYFVLENTAKKKKRKGSWKAFCILMESSGDSDCLVCWCSSRLWMWRNQTPAAGRWRCACVARGRCVSPRCGTTSGSPTQSGAGVGSVPALSTLLQQR